MAMTFKIGKRGFQYRRKGILSASLLNDDRAGHAAVKVAFVRISAGSGKLVRVGAAHADIATVKSAG